MTEQEPKSEVLASQEGQGEEGKDRGLERGKKRIRRREATLPETSPSEKGRGEKELEEGEKTQEAKVEKPEVGKEETKRIAIFLNLIEAVSRLEEKVAQLEGKEEETSEKLQNLRRKLFAIKKALGVVSEEQARVIEGQINEALERIKEREKAKEELQRKKEELAAKIEKAKEAKEEMPLLKEIEKESGVAITRYDQILYLLAEYRSELSKEPDEAKRKILEGKIARLEFLRQGWFQVGVDYLRENHPQVLTKVERLVEEKRVLAQKTRELLEQPDISFLTRWQEVLKLVESFYSEKFEEGEEVPESIREILRDFYRQEVDKLTEELFEKVGIEVPKSLEEQYRFVRERMGEIRKLGVSPELITSSTVWLNLIQWLTKGEVADEVRKEFHARLSLLQFGLRVTRLADENLGISDLLSASGMLTTSDVARLLKIPEVVAAYDLLEEQSHEKTTNPLKVTSRKEFEEMRRELAKELCGRLKWDKDKKEKMAEAEALVEEAYDLFFQFGNMQHIEDSSARLASVRKVLDFPGWLRDKFPSQFSKEFSSSRFFVEEEGRLVPASDQELGLGIRKPYQALFEEFSVADLLELGFTVSRGRERIFNWRGEECYGIDPSREEVEFVPGIWIFEREGMRLEAIVYTPQEKGQPPKEASLESLEEKQEKRRIVVVRVENPKARVIAAALERAPEGWIGNYYKELNYGEETRKAFLDSGLLAEPVGSFPEELESPSPGKRLGETARSGKLYGNLAWRRYSEEEIPPFVLTAEDMIESYVDAVLAYARSKEGQEKKFSYRLGGAHLQSALLYEARREGLITKEGEERLEKVHFGSSLSRYIKAKLALYTAPFRHPLVKASLIVEGILNFLAEMFNYVFEGTGVDFKKFLPGK